MENSKLMKRVGYLVIGSFAVFNIFMLFIPDRFPIGDLSYGRYSIYSSLEFYYAYHLWGIALGAICIYAMAKEVRMLFMVSMFLLMVVMFYPYFTSSPTERAKGRLEQKGTFEFAPSDSGSTNPADTTAGFTPAPDETPEE